MPTTSHRSPSAQSQQTTEPPKQREDAICDAYAALHAQDRCRKQSIQALRDLWRAVQAAAPRESRSDSDQSLMNSVGEFGNTILGHTEDKAYADQFVELMGEQGVSLIPLLANRGWQPDTDHVLEGLASRLEQIDDLDEPLMRLGQDALAQVHRRPKDALTNARRINEYILGQHAHEGEYRSDTLERIGEPIKSHLHFMHHLGNAGVHYSTTTVITERDALPVVASMVRVLEWYAAY